MIFTGVSSVAGGETLDYTPTSISPILDVTLFNAIYDELLLSKNGNTAYTTTIPQKWDFDTVLHATFDGHLHGGNVTYTADQVSEMRIKRREKGSYEWTTLFTVPIQEQDDFKFERFDRYARSQTEYEYCLIPVINKIEGNININSIESSFDGVFVMEKELGFGSMISASSQVNKNRPTVSVVPIDRQFPYVFGNGSANYYSGVASAIFLEINEHCQIDYKHGWRYRKNFMDFLCNGKPKILKMGDGQMWLVSIVDMPTETINIHESAPTTSFSWVETDNCENSHALYVNGFIDVDLDKR